MPIADRLRRRSRCTVWERQSELKMEPRLARQCPLRRPFPLDVACSPFFVCGRTMTRSGNGHSPCCPTIASTAKHHFYAQVGLGVKRGFDLGPVLRRIKARSCCLRRSEAPTSRSGMEFICCPSNRECRREFSGRLPRGRVLGRAALIAIRPGLPRGRHENEVRALVPSVLNGRVQRRLVAFQAGLPS